MPLQNRVTPFGDIIATPERGLFTGNRGIIHDPDTKTLLQRRWTTKAWIICLCEFQGRRREVMDGRSWTELFFLDEATALAAGHRPCFFCRREDARRFFGCWEEGNHVREARAPDVDAMLHHERLRDGRKRLHPPELPVARLPEGTMVTSAGESYLVAKGGAWRWSHAGYQKASMPREAMLLTPPSTVQALTAGYRPVLHPSVRV